LEPDLGRDRGLTCRASWPTTAFHDFGEPLLSCEITYEETANVFQAVVMLVSYIVITGLSGSFASTGDSTTGLAVIPFLFM
jgi:hypothetical protein